MTVMRFLVGPISLSYFEESLDYIVDTMSCPLEAYLDNFFKNVFHRKNHICHFLLYFFGGIQDMLIRMKTGKYQHAK